MCDINGAGEGEGRWAKGGGSRVMEVLVLIVENGLGLLYLIDRRVLDWLLELLGVTCEFISII